MILIKRWAVGFCWEESRTCEHRTLIYSHIYVNFRHILVFFLRMQLVKKVKKELLGKKETKMFTFPSLLKIKRMKNMHALEEHQSHIQLTA